MNSSSPTKGEKYAVTSPPYGSINSGSEPPRSLSTGLPVGAAKISCDLSDDSAEPLLDPTSLKSEFAGGEAMTSRRRNVSTFQLIWLAFFLTVRKALSSTHQQGPSAAAVKGRKAERKRVVTAATKARSSTPVVFSKDEAPKVEISDGDSRSSSLDEDDDDWRNASPSPVPILKSVVSVERLLNEFEDDPFFESDGDEEDSPGGENPGGGAKKRSPSAGSRDGGAKGGYKGKKRRHAS